MKPRVVLADSQAVVAEALARLLEPDFEVVGLATSGALLVKQATGLEPALVVTDVSLRGMSGLAAAGRILLQRPRTRVVLLTACEDERLAAQAFRLGAVGYVLRSTSGSGLVTALKTVLRGERWLSPELAEGDPDALSDPGGCADGTAQPPQARGGAAARGGALDEGDRRGARHHAATVAYHKYQAMETLAVRSTAQLVRFAFESRLLGSGGN